MRSGYRARRSGTMNEAEYIEKDATELAALVREREVTPTELLDLALRRAHARDAIVSGFAVGAGSSAASTRLSARVSPAGSLPASARPCGLSRAYASDS